MENLPHLTQTSSVVSVGSVAGSADYENHHYSSRNHHGSAMKDGRLQHSPAHVYSDCSCALHVFESDEDQPITGHVLQGRIPLIKVSSGTVELSDFESDAGEVPIFVAISHVRSQGLGNWTSNSLYMCQLERLQNLANKLYNHTEHPVAFWIDTACIPITQPGKANALELLGAVYRRASIVLSLDTAIERSSGTSAREDLEIVKQSAWARRLWTIREGALGTCVKFQFQEEAVSFDDILQQRSTSPDLPVPTWIATANHLRQLRENRTSDELRLLDVLWMFEFDVRVYLGRAPGTQRYAAWEVHKNELRRLLLVGYLSTSRYRDFTSSGISTEQRDAIRTLLSQVYHGLIYKALQAQKAENKGRTSERIEEIRAANLAGAT